MGWLGTALTTPASTYLVMLGTNDIQSADCTFAGMVKGYSQIVLLLRAGARVLFKSSPRVFLLAPPSIANSKAEKRRTDLLIPAMEKVAYDTGARFVPSVALAREEMWHDGIHLRPAGAKIIAKAERSAIQASRAPRFVLKEPQFKSAVTPVRREKALLAAREMGPQDFFAQSRGAMRIFAKKYHIPARTARKEEMAKDILAKIGFVLCGKRTTHDYCSGQSRP